MKKAGLLIAAVTFGINVINAQKTTDVPVDITTTFNKNYPSAKDVEWEKEGNNYEVEFQLNNVENSVLYDSKGAALQVEVEIPLSELPKKITDACAKAHPGTTIKEASRITDSTGNVTYEVEIDKKDYIYDMSGNMIKKEVDKESDDKK